MQSPLIRVSDLKIKAKMLSDLALNAPAGRNHPKCYEEPK